MQVVLEKVRVERFPGCFTPESTTFLRRVSRTLLLGAFLLAALISIAPGYAQGETRPVNVAHVIDGDTVILASKEKVRLLGINAPERKHKDRSAQPYALEALLAMEELVEGKRINLVEGKQQTDTYGRTLGYLELPNGDDVQQILLERGYAFAVAFPPDIDRLEHYLAAESSARQNKLGIWQNDFYDPVDTDRRTWISPGFGLFKGTIHRVGKSAKNVLIEVGKSMVITIRHNDWNSFWQGNPATLEGKVIVFRGWVSRSKDKNYLRIRHSSMMRVMQ